MLFLLLAWSPMDGTRATEAGGATRCWSTIFALGLAAKPMIMTLPILLLLWDHWPLKRIASDSEASPNRAHSTSGSWPKRFPCSLSRRRVLDHAVRTASQALSGSAELLPLGLRIENGIYSYVAYVGKGHLAIPAGGLLSRLHFNMESVYGGTADRDQHCARLAIPQKPLLSIYWLALVSRSHDSNDRHGTGRTASDGGRYAYLPFVGLFIIAVWGCADLFERLKLSSVAARTIVAALISPSPQWRSCKSAISATATRCSLMRWQLRAATA